MPIIAAQITLSNVTPVEIVQAHNMPHRVTLHNMSKSSNQFIHLGNSDVNLTNSVHMDPGDTLTLLMMPSDSLFAVSNPNGLKVGVLDIRKAN